MAREVAGRGSAGRRGRSAPGRGAAAAGGGSGVKRYFILNNLYVVAR